MAGQSYSNSKKLPETTHINIAPLVDVMLVLLIIFMVTAPMMQKSVDIDLPKTSNVQTKDITDAPIVISIARNGGLYLNGDQVNSEELIQKMKQTAKPDSVIQIKADQKLFYEKIFEILHTLVNNGYNKISLIAESK